MPLWLGRRVVLFLGLVALASGCASPPAPKELVQSAPRKPTIVFMTDFGTANDAVAICKAVIAGIAPDARITDITHQVTPFQIEEASRFLYGVTPYYPAGTVFLVVVDPGVGTSRKAIIVKTKKGQFFVLPDNGLVSAVVDRDGLAGAREITNQSWMIQAAVSSTFHGRNIFFPGRRTSRRKLGLHHRWSRSSSSSFASRPKPLPSRTKESPATSLVSTILLDR